MKKPRPFGKRWVELEKKRLGVSRIDIVRNDTGRVVATAYSKPIKLQLNIDGVNFKREASGSILIG